MPSYLGRYDNCAKNRTEKFKRAVDSWCVQTHNEKELIIVSDGCETTEEMYETFYSKKSNIKLKTIEKQPLFSGMVREEGLKMATGEIITYLDTDDYFTPSHLSNVESRIREQDLDWAYWSDFIKINSKNSIIRNVQLIKGVAGTSSIGHKRSLDVSWEGCNGYGHDWTFIERLKATKTKHDKIYGCGYIVCHIVKQIDN